MTTSLPRSLVGKLVSQTLRLVLVFSVALLQCLIVKVAAIAGQAGTFDKFLQILQLDSILLCERFL